MISKKDFRKINDYLWEIPKSFRKDMRVPARLYASHKMWDVLETKSLEQLINTTTMPGVVRYTIAMPDIHMGYGPPIGGVGAMKVSDGVISPGFVGYDQNCTSPDTKVLSSLGFYLPIKDFEEKEGRVKFVDLEAGRLNEADVIGFIKKHNNPIIYKIITESGEQLKATGDHPVWTKQGMKEIRKLKEGEEVLVQPFKGVEYKKPCSKVILDEKTFKKLLKNFRKTRKENTPDKILRYIKSRKLLPLRYDSSVLPYILKVMGFIFGDGVITFINQKRGIVWFYGKSEDLEEIRKDIKRIGVVPSRIYSRKRNHSITTFYDTYKFASTEYSFKVCSDSFAFYLVALGVPYGPKAHQQYRVPKWIFDCVLWQKRLFLASFFGAELSKPSTTNKYNFYAPQLNMSKTERLEKNAILFLKDIAKLLKEFGIKTYSVKKVPGYQYKGKLGKTMGFRMQIAGEAENIIKFFETIGYEYNQEKQREACLATSYLKRKLKIVELREKTRRKVRELYKGKGDFEKIAKQYVNQYTPRQFLYHSLFEEDSHGVRRKRGFPRIAFNFPSFEEYKEKYSFGQDGLVWERIDKIEKTPYSDFVYDITVNDVNHNFIANSFVVSNCGVRLLKSDLREEEIRPRLDKVATRIQKEVPSGLGKGRKTKLSISQINKILEKGVPYLVDQGYGTKEDIENCESYGRLEQADASFVSDRAKNRGRNQVGTLGSGNHFCEINRVEEIFDEQVARAFGLFKGQVVVMIHSGSRGLGHQNCTDYLRVAAKAVEKYNIKLPDRELACMPFSSPEGQRFFRAMSAAANFAWANRHMIMNYIRRAWKDVLGQRFELTLLYDVAHNIAKVEEYEIQGRKIKLCVHRKGATRAFPPNHPEIPERYKQVGQPVLVPGSMGAESYVLVGTAQGEQAFYTTAHGAGRKMSRRQAIRTISGQQVVQDLKNKGIVVKSYSVRGIAEEAPLAYKDVNMVVDVIHNAGLAKKVAKLFPLAVIKGE
jgi:tRNA-splicing ligase RtcB